MAIEIDPHCGFNKRDEHYHARHHFFGLQLIRSTTYAFCATYRGRTHTWRRRVSQEDLAAMQRQQAHTPVQMISAGKRAWWWFQGQFYSLTEPYDDPHVIKGLILQWQQRRARKAARAEAVASGKAAPRQPRKTRRQTAPTPSSPPSPTAPWQVLDVDRAASAEAIKKAYLRQISLYHPDKVAHLGPDLQKLAEEKTRQINQAYEALRKSA